MPLFRGLEVRTEQERGKQKRKSAKQEHDEEELSSLRRLCLLSLADNMKDMWTQDYVQNYMDQYVFRYIMGPFSLLPGELIEELLYLLSQRNLLSRAALHLLLLPQLHSLSLARSCNLVTANLCCLIGTRCQSLKSLDLSAAVNVSSAALCSLLSGLPLLHSLSLAGTLCDRGVISTVAQHCQALQHLDISRCLHLNPGALLPLGCQRLNRLSSLLAMDIGLGEDETDGSAASAFLMLTVPTLRRLALEGVGGACALLENEDFGLTEGFYGREGMPGLGELWEKRVVEELEETNRKEMSDCSTSEEFKERLCLDKSRKTPAPGFSGERKSFKLHLQEVQGVTLGSLDAVSKLCPKLSSISLNCYDQGDEEGSSQSSLLAQGLSRWAGQLHSLSMQFPGPLSDLVPALQASGLCLVSLTVEGVQADGQLPFLTLLSACPKLSTLILHIDPPHSNQEVDDDDEVVDWSLPCLPHLRNFTLNFSMDEGQLKPVLCWTSLKGTLCSLLRGALHLHTLSLIAVPCRLDPVFSLVLDLHTQSLRRLRHVSLKRCDVTMETTTRLVDACFYLNTLDVSGCWSLTLSNVNKLQSRARRRRHKLQITWT